MAWCACIKMYCILLANLSYHLLSRQGHILFHLYYYIQRHQQRGAIPRWFGRDRDQQCHDWRIYLSGIPRYSVKPSASKDSGRSGETKSAFSYCLLQLRIHHCLRRIILHEREADLHTHWHWKCSILRSSSRYTAALVTSWPSSQACTHSKCS